MTSPAPVHRRAVFYVPGYDPRRPRVYHALFAEELAAAARLRGYEARAGALDETDPLAPAFAMDAQIEGVATRARVAILRWDDVARPAFKAPLVRRLPKLLAIGLDLARRGVLRRLGRLDWQFAAFVAYPYVMTVLIALAILALAVFAGAAAGSVSPLLAPAAALATLLAGWFVALRIERPLYLRYLLEDWLLSFAHERGETDVLAQRVEAFAARIVAAARAQGEERVDEILLVGHSSGAFLAPETLAAALRADPDLPRQGPAIALLTIGTVAPLMLVDAPGSRYEAALRRLAHEPGIVWHELQSRHDAMNACPVDPAALAGLPDARWPLVMRLSMPQLVRPGQLGLFRERLFFFRTHFRFLKANERPVDYDFYGMLVGPKRLAERHRVRQPVGDRHPPVTGEG